jgi:hypothetical protein
MATEATTPEKLAYTMREAGRAIGCCERLIWGFIKSGDLKAVKLGRSVRITHVELVRFLESRQG